MSIFRRRTRADLERVRAELTRMGAALHHQEQRATSVEASVAQRAVVPTPDPAPAADPELVRRLDQLAAQVAALDARITSVSRELVNQLTELGNDIDTLQQRPDAAAVDEAVLEGLQDAQARLANEQARYQIAFRSDLARLAEELRKPRT
jgi:predicted transcriptional regulator